MRRPRRTLPWVLLAVGLALLAGALLMHDRLMGWIGLGGGEETTQAVAARPQRTPPVQSAPAPVPVLPEEESAAAAPSASTSTVPPAAPEPTPAAEPDTGPALTRLERITWEPVSGGTDVILWGNGAIRPEVYTRTRLGGNPPRELIRLSGIRRSYSKGREVVGTPEVLQVRVGYHPEAGRGELHVVLDLAHPRVAVTGIEPGPRQLRIHLRRR